MQWKVPFKSGPHVLITMKRGVRISKIAGMTGGVLIREVTFISEVLKLLEWFPL